MPMVETQEALDNLEAIAKTDGVNCVLIGPSDLSINIGVPLDYKNPKYHDALNRVGSVCRENDVAPRNVLPTSGHRGSRALRKGIPVLHSTLEWLGAGRNPKWCCGDERLEVSCFRDSNAAHTKPT